MSLLVGDKYKLDKPEDHFCLIDGVTNVFWSKVTNKEPPPLLLKCLHFTKPLRTDNDTDNRDVVEKFRDFVL